MSKCPHCEQNLKIPERYLRNAATYHNIVIAVTECCNKAIHIRPVVKFEFTKYSGTRVEDDWGVPIQGSVERYLKDIAEDYQFRVGHPRYCGFLNTEPGINEAGRQFIENVFKYQSVLDKLGMKLESGYSLEETVFTKNS